MSYPFAQLSLFRVSVRRWTCTVDLLIFTFLLLFFVSLWSHFLGTILTMDSMLVSTPNLCAETLT